MRKGIYALLFLLAACLSLALPAYRACALGVETITQEAQGGAVTYPRLYTGDAYDEAEDGEINRLLRERLAIDNALALLEAGARMTGETTAATVRAPREALSLRFTTSGLIRFGRFDQTVRALALDAQTCRELPFDALFADPAAARAWLDAYAQDEVLPTLNAYLNRDDIVPVPTDALYLEANGVTFYYPSEAFCWFSGRCGALNIQYWELWRLLSDTARQYIAPPLPPGAPDAQSALDLAREGRLSGLDGELPLRVGESLHAALAYYGQMAEPDYITGGEVYECEDARLRGVTLVAARGAQDDQEAALTSIRATRLCFGGLATGIATRDDCIQALGAPLATLTLDAHTAEGYRLRPGAALTYGAGAYTLTLYCDTDGMLYAVALSG